MHRIFKLKNPIKHYDWGSPDWIPQMLGVDNKEKTPWAELWMGIHPEGPSAIDCGDKHILLSELISQDPPLYLGAETYSRFKALPFLFKLLAAGKPLSIQVHPSLPQAQAGWERENRKGIPLRDPQRNYKDPNHKPEILCALNNFRALCGFREPEEIIRGLKWFVPCMPKHLQGGVDALARTLQGSEDLAHRMRLFLRALFDLSLETKQAVSTHILSCQGELFSQYPEYAREWEVMAYFAGLYPGDIGVLAPLYLHIIDLHPAQGIYIPAGVLHAYVSGFGVELMANSDNVLRGGLTPKYMDREELLSIVRFTPFNPAILSPQGSDYPIFCSEFSISILGNQGDRPYFLKPGPWIVIVTAGKLTITYKKGESVYILKQGESAFIPAIDKPEDFAFHGNFTLYAAGIGNGNP